MVHYNYLIVGGGMTAAAAVEGIREIDETGTIGMIGEEKDPPYNRPPLSKGLWKGKSLETIWRKAENQNVDYRIGIRVEMLDPLNKRAVDNQGEVYTYDKLLLATGGRPRKLPFGENQIQYYRTLEDYRYLQELASRERKFAVIGGGFIGSEIAAALRTNGQQVTMVFPEAGIGARVFPPDLSHFINEYYREKGVEVLAGRLITGLEQRNGNYALKIGDGEEILVDGVVAGIGIQPNVELAIAAGIEAEDGICVDEFLRTNRKDIYAAGDVAAFYNPHLKTHLRVEHEDNANTMGRIAGRNMAGEPSPYNHLPYFYSDLFDLGYEAVGELSPELNIVVDWQEPYQKGIVYYLKEGQVRGVLLWNIWDQVAAARELIAEPGTFKAAELLGRLPR